MKVLSLFDGISCGRMAFERAGIPVEKYYSSEIDKYAIAVAQAMYPDTVQIGDVTKIDWKDYKDVDIIIGGSPCQDLSIAKQNRQGLRGERSGLFWKYVDALKEIHPKYFLLENVASMRDEDRDAITDTLRAIYPETECIKINSALVSAQQRKRYYWTNWHNEQPEDRGILLKDILESGEVIRGDKSHAVMSSCARTTEREYFVKNQGDMKAYCIDANCFKGSTLEHTLDKHKRELIAEPVALRNRGSGKQPGFNGTGKANSLTTVQTDSMVCEPIRVGTIGKGGQGNRVYSVRGKSICLSSFSGGLGSKTGLYKVDLPDGDYVIRKLTPRECCRLQTYDERCFDVANISNTQWYKAFGNGWTVDVIVHLLKGIK